MRGGYTLVDFFDTSLSSTPVKIDGITNRFISSKRKTFLFLNVKIGVELMNDVFTSSYIDDNNDLCFPCYEGYIKVTDGDMVSYHKNSGGGSPYTLPVATELTLGGIKVGQNLTVEADGTLNAQAGGTYSLPTASASTLGGVKIGDNITIDIDGKISAPAAYSLPIAGANTLGGVKAGSNVSIAQDGTISAISAQPAYNYSTIEQVVGTWIDGKPLYQITLVLNGSYSGSMDSIATIGSGKVVHFISGIGEATSDRKPIPNVNAEYPTADYGIKIVNSTGDIDFRGSNDTISVLEITIRYTKTTD